MKKRILSTALLLVLGTVSVKADTTIIEGGMVSATVGNDGSVTKYTYDAVGNITQEGQIKFEYSDEGQLKSQLCDGNRIDYGYDSFGRLVSAGGASLSYDSHSSMMNLYKSLATNASYAYDFKSGMRVSKTVNGKTVNFVLDDLGRVIEERDALDNTISRIVWDGETPSHYVYGDSTYKYVCNYRGDVVALVNESGEKVNTYKYDIWGKLLESKEAIPNAIRYNHEYYDEESGFYYLRGRYYDPSTRRFTTPDPAEDGINWYTYCGNNPIDYIDPSGYAFYKYEQRWGNDIVVKKYYSGDDLTHLFKQESLWEWVVGGLAASPIVTKFIPKSVLAACGLALTPSKLIDTAQTRVISDKAYEAFHAKKGICITINIDLDGGLDFPVVSVVPAKQVEDYASGKVKHPNI